MNIKKEKLNFNWKPDKTSKISLTKQIVRFVIDQISSGNWIAGKIFPSQRKLAEILEVNRSTIVDAFAELSSLGVIMTTIGSGTYIANDSWALFLTDKYADGLWNVNRFSAYFQRMAFKRIIQ